MALDDLLSISLQEKDWMLKGAHNKEQWALDIQRLYLEKVKETYHGRDEITDDLTGRWEYILNTLERDPSDLVGIIDWPTKKEILRAYQRIYHLETNDPALNALDIDYHLVHKEEGVFTHLLREHAIHPLTTASLIEHAVHNPPRDTRAFFRGTLLRKRIHAVHVSWDSCEIFDMGTRHVLNNPFDTYEDLLVQLYRKDPDEKKYNVFWNSLFS